MTPADDEKFTLKNQNLFKEKNQPFDLVRMLVKQFPHTASESCEDDV